MPEQTEKLLHFTEEVLRNAARESEQIKQELDETRAKAMEEAKAEAKTEARMYYDREAARIRAESGREVSRHLMDIKRQVYLRRKEIGGEVFEQVKKRIGEFTQSPEYPAHLEAMLAKAMTQLPGAKSISLRLRREDLQYGPELAKSVAPVKVEYEEGSFSLGGLAVRCEELGLRVDCSFDNQLAELADHFAESFGLSLSDDLDET